MPLGYEQLKEDFEAAAAEKEQAEAEQAKAAPASEPEKDESTEASLGDEDDAA